MNTMRDLIKLMEAPEDKSKPAAKTIQEKLKTNTILSWWQLEEKLRKAGDMNQKQALAFFCPVYFAGQFIVKKLLDERDEHGEMLIFPLPTIYNPQRIEVGIKQMEALGIKNPERLLANDPENGKGLKTFSSLPGIEGANTDHNYEYIAYEAVQLGAFQIVPKRWLNAGDPYNDSYRFPGEEGYSPYWRIPKAEEFAKMRPDMFSSWKKKNGSHVRKFD